jgi:hypothetical protein
MNLEKKYDYCIIGAGPVGLTLAFLFSKIGKSCLILDNMNSIGGCHRVNRITTPGNTYGLFTEHSPRIYSNSYVNTINILKCMNINFFDLFTPYNFSISNIGGKTINSLTKRELFTFVKEFFKLYFNPNHGRNISMESFLTSNNFKQESMDYIDRLCRLTDGAGIDRYTLYEFLNLANQEGFYKIYQPKLPNDLGLFKQWQKFLDKTNLVDIKLNRNVTKLIGINNIEYCQVKTKENKIENFTAKNFILAIPPKAIFKILENSNTNIQNAFGPIRKIKELQIKSSYITDPAITFHWDTKLNLPKVWGMPSSDWGIAFILLSDYMNFHDPRSKTVFSCCITRLDSLSTKTNKTANQTKDKDELIKEVFRQLKTTYQDLPEPSFSILSPTVYYYNNEWTETDSAYIETYLQLELSSHGKIKNLFNCGMHNGNSIYAFTSLEGAVTNALSLSHKLEPKTKCFKIRSMYTLISFIKRILFLILISLILIIIYKSK